MVKLIVTAKKIRYDRKEYLAGETFEATEKDAKLLKAVRKAQDAPKDAATPAKRRQRVVQPSEAQADADKPAGAMTTYRTSALLPMQADRPAGDDEAGRKRYPRRDMTAENSGDA